MGGFLGGLMSFYVDARGQGKVIATGNGVIHLATCRKFAPDAFFVNKRRLPRRLPKVFEGAPDLVVEVLSESTRDFDLNDKLPAYEAAGVKEIWFIDRDAPEILLCKKHGRGYKHTTIHTGKVESSVIPGFWIEADWLWSVPLPNRMDCLLQILGSSESPAGR